MFSVGKKIERTRETEKKKAIMGDPQCLSMGSLEDWETKEFKASNLHDLRA